MKKVLIIHGFKGTPNGGWRSWLMGELDKQHVWAAALPMPTPDAPICDEWVEKLGNYVEENKGDELYLVGHSLGSTTILRYLESASINMVFPGVVLVSGPIENLGKTELENFLDKPFNFEAIKSKAKTFSIIHGSNDDRVPLSHGEKLAKELGATLTVIENGGHLNGRSGWHLLPHVLEGLVRMFEK